MASRKGDPAASLCGAPPRSAWIAAGSRQYIPAQISHRPSIAKPSQPRQADFGWSGIRAVAALSKQRLLNRDTAAMAQAVRGICHARYSGTMATIDMQSTAAKKWGIVPSPAPSAGRAVRLCGAAMPASTSISCRLELRRCCLRRTTDCLNPCHACSMRSPCSVYAMAQTRNQVAPTRAPVQGMPLNHGRACTARAHHSSRGGKALPAGLAGSSASQ